MSLRLSRPAKQSMRVSVDPLQPPTSELFFFARNVRVVKRISLRDGAKQCHHWTQSTDARRDNHDGVLITSGTWHLSVTVHTKAVADSISNIRSIRHPSHSSID